MNTEHELFGELHEHEENGLFGNEHIRHYEAQQEALRQFGVMPSLPNGLDDDSNCVHNFKLGWIACWKALTGNDV